jgi:hypothetical protein
MNGTVYGYFPGIGSLMDLKSDGSFYTYRGGAINNSYEKLKFTSNGCKYDNLGNYEMGVNNSDTTASYFINNKPVTKESYYSFICKQDEKKGVFWYKFSPKKIETDLANCLKDTNTNDNSSKVENNSLNGILKYLKMQSLVSAIKTSPNSQYVAYAYSEDDVDFQLFLWKVGDEKPVLVMIVQCLGDLFWTPNSKYIIVDNGTYVFRSCFIVSEMQMKNIGEIKYFADDDLIISPDSKFVVFTMGEKCNTGFPDYGGQSLSIGIFDFEKNTQITIAKGTSEFYFESESCNNGVITYKKEYFADKEKDENFEYDYNVK